MKKQARGPIKGGGSNPRPFARGSSKKSSIDKRIEKIVNHSVFKTVLSLIPLISLLFITLSTNYYYFFNNSYSVYYDLISYCTGFSLFSLPAYFYIVYKYGFCDYSKFALFGITSYIITNIMWFFANLFFSIEQNIYTNVFEALTITIFLILSIYHWIKSNKTIKNERVF